ncbi:ABC transporter permease, partial [uncultured Ruthenibacterium sp.]
MKKHLRVLRTLFVKDIVDMFKNPNVLLMLALPLIFIVIYQFVDLGMSPAYLLMLGVMMNLCLTPLSVLGMMIAEEKEKNTMRTLMLCNVTGGEFLAAKTLAVLAGTLLVDTVLFFLTGFGPVQLPVFLLVCTAGSITMLLLGGLTGIVCRDQTSTGTIAGPLALVFMLPTMFAGMGGVLQKVASFVPTTATADLMFL